MISLLLAASAMAFPTGAFPDCDPEVPGTCPTDFSNQWYLASTIPEGSRDTIRAEEVTLGSGIWADYAWRYTTGRFDTSIAILDSGIEWDAGMIRTQVRLNSAELPTPRDASGVEVPGGDVDGNGLYNIDDWAVDGRVAPEDGIDQADGVLDPSDLIAVFSDGVDDDGNGYVDDIAGWDFFENDNNAWPTVIDTLNAGHGTGVMRDAAAGADDGHRIGVCPNCSIVPLRVGDAFITDGDRVAAALSYCADNGIDVAGMALGALSHGGHTREAVRRAHEAGVVMVGAAGDENSWHHNWPAADDPILYVHSIRADNQNEDGGVYSYLSTWNCNNWGPRLDFVAPGDGCATASVAVISGSAGLIRAAGRDVGIELDADEVLALLRGTVDDVWLTQAQSDEAKTYPSREGWDTFHGYGRVNVGRAVQAVFEGDIPPVSQISGPRWFDWVDPDVPVPISGRVAAPRDSVQSWKIEAGAGGEPTEWAEVASGSGSVEGEIATVDLSAFGDHAFRDLGSYDLLERVDRAHQAMVTLRLVVTDSAGRTTVDRQGVYAHRDSTRKPGFPIDLGGSGEPAPVLADLTGDGVFEIVVGTATGEVHVYDGSGQMLPGFPVAVDRGMAAGTAVGDVDGDGEPEVVAASLGGDVWAWNTDGTVVGGFPVQTLYRLPEELGPETAWDNGVMSTPALGDIDGDGALEIVVGGLDQRLYAWKGDGSAWPGFPLELCAVPGGCSELGARIVSSPALGDIDGDGDLDAAIGTNEVPPGASGPVYLIDLATATNLDGSPMLSPGLINEPLIPVIGEGHPSSVALADIDRDGDLELLSNPMLGTNGVIHHDGAELRDLRYTADAAGPGTNFTGGSFLAAISTPAFGDMTGDGIPDPIIGGVGVDWLISLALTKYIDYQHAIGAWDGRTGASLPGWPRQLDDISFLVAPSMADVDLDGDVDALYATGGHFIYAWDQHGHIAAGFPKFTGGWSLSGPAIGDIDGDGLLDVVATTREGTLFAWGTAGLADQKVQWASNRHDAANTGNYETPLPQQAGPTPGASEAGCCGGGGSGSAWVVIPALFLVYRRRRERAFSRQRSAVS